MDKKNIFMITALFPLLVTIASIFLEEEKKLIKDRK